MSQTSQGVAPALRTYNTLIIASNMCNQPRDALAIYQELLAENFTPNSTTYNALISAHGKLGQLDKVLEVRGALTAWGGHADGSGHACDAACKASTTGPGSWTRC